MYVDNSKMRYRGGNVPMVMILDERTDSNVVLGCAPCLRARDYKDPPCVCFGLDSWNQSVCEEILPVLRASGGGEQSPKVIAVYDDTE